ncbi:MAG TPA: hypothetical protein VGZ22_03935, partial [Isosphaeraceae bacterium]|nr:hypothetical protein [Isosphaeraceae bacterium]
VVNTATVSNPTVISNMGPITPGLIVPFDPSSSSQAPLPGHNSTTSTARQLFMRSQLWARNWLAAHDHLGH